MIVSGRAGAYEGTVNVEVRGDGMLAGQSLGSGFVTATGQPGLFQEEIAFRSPSETGEAVLFQDRSGAGVGETDAFATTVVRVLCAELSLTG